MEEILASIRRIIADDQEAPKAATPKPPVAVAVAPAPPPPPPALDDEEVLELSEVAQPVKLAKPPRAIDEEQAVEIAFRDFEEPAAPEPVIEEPPLRARAPEPVQEWAPPRELDGEDLLSQATHASVGSAFNMLAHTVLSSNARTLEDLVRDMLRPMLKNWLDDNLPTIVERLVRAEIERVARGGR